MSDRGDRLHEEKRKKAKMRKIMGRMFMANEEHRDKFLGPRSVGKAAHTPHPCSGRCCGNPRCHCKGKDKLTMQELKEIEREKD